MGEKRRGQFAMEYLLVIGFSLLLLLPIMNLITSQYTDVRTDISLQKSEEAVLDLITNIETLFQQGPMNRKTVQVDLAKSIDDIQINSANNAIIIMFSDGTEREYYSNVNIQGTLEPKQSLKLRLTVIADEGQPTNRALQYVYIEVVE